MFNDNFISKRLDGLVKIVYNQGMNLTTNKSLLDMRKAKGWSAEEAGRRLGQETGKGSYTHSRILQIEKDGVNDAWLMEALAKIYDTSFDDIRSAVKFLQNRQ